MSIETFGIQEFESKLPTGKKSGRKLWTALGLVKGEYCYLVDFGATKESHKILLRSSIKASGVSASLGKDSIRAYIVDTETLKPVMGKSQAWVTRTVGWDSRMLKMFGALKSKYIKSRCHCGGLLETYRVKKKNVNYGKQFTKCAKCNNFTWL